MRLSTRTHVQHALGTMFRLERRLESGPTARVFVAHDLKHDRLVVLKVLRADSASAVDIERFRRETRLAATLRHAQIVPLLTAGDADGMLYYTMPYVAGESLRQRLRRGRALPAADSVRILLDVARALEHAHERGIIHRDVKPDNILLRDGRGFVTDLGIARAVSPDPGEPVITLFGITLGTPGYMAPEQLAAQPTLDHRADLFSLGVVAYEMLAGSLPYPSNGTPRDSGRATPVSLLGRRRDLAAPLDSLVHRLLARDRAERPATTREVVRALEVLLHGDRAPTLFAARTLIRNTASARC